MPLSLEQKARSLRDEVFGVPITESSWLSIRDNWMKPENIRWLETEAAKIRAKRKVKR